MADGYANRLNADPADGTPQYPAQAERLFAAFGLMPGSSALRVRTGRRLGTGLELAVAADGLTATVQPGTCVVPSPDATNGPYVVAIPTAVTLTLPARPLVSLQRRDRVVVRVYDEEIASLGTTLRESRVELITGTAASSPTAPALPTVAYEVGQLNSTSSATSVYSTNLERTWSAGGVGVVYSQAERDALTVYDGLKVYRNDLGRFDERVAGAWRAEGGDDTGWLELGTPAGAWTKHATEPLAVRKIGNRVQLVGVVSRDGSSNFVGNNTYVRIHTLGASQRPARTDIQGVLATQQNGPRMKFRLIRTTGDLEIANDGADLGTNGNVYFNVSWQTD